MTRVNERIATFGSASQLVGVYCEPAEPPATPLPTVLLLNAGLLHRIGAQRMHTQLARRLAARGYASLRFDCSGIGDSEVRGDGLPFAEASVEETSLAMDWCADHGLEGARGAGFVLFGLCSGADQAFQTGLVDGRVRGAVLLDPYPYETPGFRLHRVARPLRRGDTWKRFATGGYHLTWRLLRRLAGESEPRGEDPGLAVRRVPARAVAEAGYHAMLERGVALYVVFTAGQLGTYNHANQFWDMHPSLPRDATSLRYTYLESADHTLTNPAQREVFFQHFERWLDARFAGQVAKRG